MRSTSGGEEFDTDDRALRESQEQTRLVLDHTTSAFYSVDRDGNTTLVSRPFLEMIGFKDESEAIGRKLHDLIHHTHPDGSHYPVEQCPIYRCASSATPAHVPEELFFRLNGTAVPVEYWVAPIMRGDEHIGATCTIIDLTQRKQADQALRESELRFRNMADHAPVMMWVTEPDGYCSYLNRSWYEFTGQSEDQALGFGWLGAVHPDDSAEVGRIFLSANAKHEPFRIEYRLRDAKGDYRWAIDAAAPRFDQDGAFLGFVGSVVDIDDRKRAEEALAARNRRLDLLARITGWLVVETSPQESVQSAFEAIADEVGAGYYFNYLVDDDDPSTMRLASSGGLSSEQKTAFARIGVGEYLCGRVAATRQPVIIDDLDQSNDPACAAVIELDGKCYAGFPLVSAGRLMGTISFASTSRGSFSDDQVGLMRTVAYQAAVALDRSRIVAALSDSEEQFRTLAENVSQLAWMAEPDGSIFWYNKRWYDYTGTDLESMKDWGWREVHHPDHIYRVIEEVSARWADGIRWEGTYLLRSADGAFRPFLTRAEPIRDADGNLIRWFGTNTDITAQLEAEEALRHLNETLESRVTEEVGRRTEAEEALRQSQKMETLGQLTGGIAHDFNNLLQIITGNLDVLRRTIPTDSPRLQRSVENALKGADRAAVLTQRLLAFSRRQPLVPTVINPNKLVSGMSELLHRAIGETVAIETVLGSGLWRVEADSNQLETALLNLAVNARDAMPDGGKLTIETANTHLDHNYSEQHSGVLAGQYVAICVSDTGSGMDAATAERAFDPFFTTKEVGKGTGLGLSMVYGFVKQSGGHLKIYSELDEGTTVKIYLPRHHGEETEVEDDAGADVVAEGIAGETILVCEDDEDVRAYSAQSLRDLGYRVIEAADGQSTLRLLESANGSVDLLFTDIVLPGGMTGAMVAESAREMQPGLKVLFTTGYARNAIVHHGRVDPGVELLSKPFSYADLAARVRDLLDTPPD